MLADSGYWLALASQRDRWHEAAVAATRHLTGPLVVTWPVITEVSHVLLSRGGVNAQTRFLDQISSHAEIHLLDGRHLPAVRSLMDKYRDLPMDLADASLVVAATERSDGRILSTDVRDFGVYRWRNTEPFENLLPSFRKGVGRG